MNNNIMQNETDFVDVILIDKDNHILLLKRNIDDDLFPDTWCLPGGCSESNEDANINARRECYEETNIVCLSLNELFKFTYENKKSTLVFIGHQLKDFKLNRQIKLSKNEHYDFGWFTFEESLKLDLCGELKILLNKAYDIISKG